MKNLLFTFLLILFGGFVSMAQLITFDDQSHVDNGAYGNPYTITNGGETFIFTVSGVTGGPTTHRYRTVDVFGCGNTGFNHLNVGTFQATTWTIETQSGNEIDLGTIRFDNFFACFSFAYNLTIQGFKNGSSTGSQVLSVPGMNTTFTSNASFNDVDRIVITCPDLGNLGIDNINWVPVVPPCTNPTVPTITSGTVCSGNTATLNITGNLNGAAQWAVYTGSCGGTLVGTTTTSSFTTAALPSNTTFFVRGEGGCVVTPGSCGSVAVNVTNIALTNASQTNVSCFGGSNGAASMNAATGGTAPYTYNWTPGNPPGDGTTSVTGLSVGVWTCTVTDAAGCTKATTVTITQPPAISVVSTGQSNVSCFGGSNGTAAVSVSGGAGGFTYNWTPGNPTGDGTVSVSGLSAGVWTCNVMDANSCTATRTFTITQPSAITSSISAQTNVSCNLGSNGSATVTAGGGTPGYTYSWAPSGGTAATATGLVAATYTCTITDASGCTKTQTVTITQPSAITSSISAQTNVSCNLGTNGAATVTAGGGTPGYTYSWAPSGGTAATATGLAAGTYTCTITDANGCTKTQTATITQPSAITMNALSQTNVSCNGGSNGVASVTAATGGTPGYSYNWTPGNPTGDGTTSVTGLTAGVWTCTVTDANGCTRAQTMTITQPTAITSSISAQTNVSCNLGSNGSATVAAGGGTPGYTYSWAPSGGTGVTATGLTAGTYTCTITDANGCTKTQTATITQPSALSLTAASQTNVSCFGGANGAASVNAATGGTAGYSYNWTPGNPVGDGTTSVAGLTAGTWTCTVTDANGCTAVQTFTITQASAITMNALSQTNVSCFGGSNGAASVTPATGGTAGYTYNWTPGNPVGDGTTSVTGLTAGTWTCTVTDANACTAVRTFTVTQPSALIATAAAQSNVSCNSGSDGTATVSASGGTASYTYSWAPSGGTGATATGLTAGTYTCTVTDANGCIAVSNFTITQPTALVATASAQTNVSCNGGSNGTATVSASGGTAGYTYSWAPSGGTGAMATGLTAGTYTCTVTDANGCTALSNFTITQPTALVLTQASQVDASCGFDNGSATVNAATGGTPSYTYDWTPGNPTGDGTTTVTGLGAGTWTCTVTDANGCSTSQTFTITTVGSPDDASFNYSSAAYCVDGSDPIPTITGLAGGTFSSSVGLVINATTGVIDVSASTPATYTVTYTTSGPCPNSSSVSVTINELDDASFSYASSSYCGNGIDPTPTVTGLAGGTFSSSAGLSLNTASGVIDLSASTPATYSVAYTTSGVCPNTTSNSVTVNALSTGIDVQVACDTFTWIDGFTYTASNNTATYTLTNAAGCDSVVTLNLTVNNSNSGTDVQAACGSFTWIDGFTYTSSNNSATFTLTNAAGCDSLVTLDLTILTQVVANISDVACDSYTWSQNGMTYTTSGTYSDTIIGGSVNGCDSIIVLTLTVNSSSSSIYVANACDSYTWINGTTYTASNNSATMVYTNAAGCDSIVTLNLTLGLSTTTTEVVTLCNPTYTWSANGTTYSSSGVYSALLTSSAGCDSTVILDLTLGGGIDVTVTQVGETLIASQFIAGYQWIDCADNQPIVGATGQSFSPTVTGSYAVIITDNNCTDTSACITVDVTGLDELDSKNVTIYPNPSSGTDITFVYDGIISNVQVYDLVGRPVINTSKLVNNKLDVSELSYGKYIVKITTESSVMTKELIIAR